MNTYVIETTTNEAWEICGGTYVVNAMTKREALKIIEEKVGERETIVECSKMNTTKKGLRVEQEAIVE